MTRWYCVQTENRQEVTAAASISGMGFVVYCPMQIVSISHARKKTHEPRPLFPRYLFVSDQHTTSAGQINNCKGVRHKGLFCDAGGRPSTISNAIIESIRARENSMKARAGELKSGYQPGDKFKIAKGPYADLEATYVGEENGKITAIVFLFGRDLEIKNFPIEALPTWKRDAA